MVEYLGEKTTAGKTQLLGQEHCAHPASGAQARESQDEKQTKTSALHELMRESVTNPRKLLCVRGQCCGGKCRGEEGIRHGVGGATSERWPREVTFMNTHER